MSESIEPFRTSFGTTRLLCRVTNNDPARSPVVCIHGLFSNSNLFEPLVSHLRAANLPNILSFDLPGFGRSPPFLSGSGGEEAGVGANRVGEEGRRPGHTIDHYTETIKAFVEAHAFAEGRCASLVCHGEGCFLALHFAAKYPALVSYLVLLCPVLPPMTDRGQHTFNLLGTLAKEKGPHALLVSLMNLTTMEYEEALKSKVGLMFGSSIAPSTEGFLGLCDVMTHTSNPSYHSVRPLDPVVILAKHDSHAPPPDARKLAQDLQGSMLDHARADLHDLKQVGLHAAIERRKERLDKCIELDGGHWVLLDRPQELAELIARALKL